MGRWSSSVVVVSLLFASGVVWGGLALAADVTAGLVQAVDTTGWSPAAPGPAGVVYLSARDSLIVVDSDRNNLPEFSSDGINLWEYSLSTGTVTNTGVMPTDEATGAGYDPATNTLFVSDDNPGRVYLVRPGDDGWFGTADDPASPVINTGALGASDTEDPAFDPVTGHLFVLSGSDAIVFDIDPVDGVFGNGNDATSMFAVPGAPNDWEGLALDASSGHLLVGAKSEKQIYEVTKTGALIRIIDAAGIPGMREISGLGVKPGSGGSNPTYWVADRGDTPITSDGMLFELTFGQVPTAPPVAQDQTVTAAIDTPVTITLTATDINEDPLIYSIVDNPLNGTLSPVVGDQVSYTPNSGHAGPDSFNFKANDGTFDSNVATVSITVVDPGSTQVIDIPVGSSTDDAEQSPGGSVSLGSSDLELVRASSGDQVVGMRFTGVGVPPGATIVDAFIQFTVDETGSVPTNLEIRAQAVDDAATFARSTNNISTRATTNSLVPWSPDPWTSVGDAGPIQRTPNMAAVIQEVIDRPGWIAGNALVAIIAGTGKRTAESFDGVQAAAPLLHIEYRDSSDAPPVVTVTAPMPGSVFAEGETVTFTATAIDPEDGDLTAGLTWTSDLDGQIGTGGNYTTSTLGVGFHTITAQATDSAGVSGSSTVTVTITGPPVNQPPTVYAGPDLEINLGDTAALAGTVDDDGLPTGTLTQRWTQLSGRGTAGFSDDSLPATTATFDLPGTYLLRLTADDGELTASADTTIRVVDPSSTQTIEVRVAANSDDAEERATGSVSLSSSDLELVFDRGGNQTVGIRFNGLAIPQGATIIDAFIQFTAEDAHSVATNLTIRAEAVDNAATFTSATDGISSRPGTAQAVAWSPDPWTTMGEAGSNQRTPSLVAVVQAVIDRTGWASGNSLVIMISGTGERSAESHNGNAGRAPLLHVEYASASP